MNTKNKKILLGLAVVLIFVLSVTVASAGLYYKIAPYAPEEPKFVSKLKCGVFSKCSPAPAPASVPAPAPITKKDNPTRINIPISKPFVKEEPKPVYDITIESHSPDTTPEGSFLINTLIKSSFKESRTGNLVVLVTGLNGQTSYQRYEREITVMSGIRAETVIIDINGWMPGAYHVLVTLNIAKNIQELDMYIPEHPVPTLIPVIMHTPAPTLAPTPVPFDVWVSGRVESIDSSKLTIVAVISHDNEQRLEGEVSATINGITKKRDVYTIERNKERTFEFDISNWNDGTYPVIVSFPVRADEPNKENNEYKFGVTISKPKPVVIDMDLQLFNTVFQRGVNSGLDRGDSFYIDYVIKNVGDKSATGRFTIKTEGTTLYDKSITIDAGQSKYDRLTISTTSFPYHVDKWNYLLIGKITTPGDNIIKNDVMNVFCPVRGSGNAGNWLNENWG